MAGTVAHMGDVTVPMDWRPGDAVIPIDPTHDGCVGIIIEVLNYKNYNKTAMVYWPRGIDFISVDAILPAFC